MSEAIEQLEREHTEAMAAFSRGESQSPSEIIAEMEGSSLRKQQVFTRYANGEISLSETVEQVRQIRPATWMERLTRTILAILLLCSTASADGPLFSIWHIDGHGYAWQQAQIDAGLPIEPSVRMVSFDEGLANLPKSVTAINTFAPLLSQLNGRSIALRMNNICREVDWTIPRVSPLTEETWRTSHMCVRRLPTGALDSTTTVSPWAGTAAWTESGKRWATSASMKRIQEIIPTPAGIILRENNEGGRIPFTGGQPGTVTTQLWETSRPRYRRANGTLTFVEPGVLPSQYVDDFGNPLTPDWMVHGDPNHLVMARWKTDAVLDTIDLRAKEWVAPRRGQLPSASAADFAALERAQYQALYAAFDANSAPGWRGKLRTTGYGEWRENRQNDAASPAMYLGYYRDPDLTKSGAYAVNRWNAGTEELANEAANPKAWREYSISVGNPPSPIYSGYQAGRHAVVDPESFSGLMAHVAWRMQSPGREVRMTYWDNYNTKATHLVFATSANATTLKQQHVDALTALGRADMLTLTIGDYEMAVLRAFDRIHDSPLLSRYWRDGTTRLMTSPLNTATATKAYATETTIPGVTAKLVYCYTPCDMIGLIQVEGLLLPAKRSGYYINGAAVEVQ